MRELLLVGFGGLIGSMARFGVQLLFVKYISEKSQLPSLLVNLTGCLLIGILAGNLMKLNQNQYLLLIIGVLGGFTTFSTFAFEGIKLLKAGLYTQFAIYFLASTIGGLILCLAGFTIAGK